MNKYFRYCLIGMALLTAIISFNLIDINRNEKSSKESDRRAIVESNIDSAPLNEFGSMLDKPVDANADSAGRFDPTPDAKGFSKSDCADYFSEIQINVSNDPAYKDYGFWLSDPVTRENLDYYNYTVDQLETLANNNDRTAQHVLADLIKNTKRTRAIYWYKQAAMRGYIYSLTSLALLIREEPSIRDKSKLSRGNLESLSADRQARQIESLAWLLVSQRAMGRSLQQALKMHTGYTLEPDEIERAKALSELYLNILKSERSKIGLGPFNNRPYPVLQIDDSILKGCLSTNSL